MSTSSLMPATTRPIVIGIDTHKDIHVAVALDHLGRRLAELHVPTTVAGYLRLEQWATGLGTVEIFGIEGTGSYGAGVARYLRQRHHRLVEVNRPDRATRYRLGKSDPIDAEMAARLVLAGVASGTPKTGDGPVEMLRLLKLAKDSAVKTRTQSMNQIKAVIVTATAELRDTLTGLRNAQLIDRCAAFRPGPLTSSAAVAKYTLRLLAKRHLDLGLEIAAVELEIERPLRNRPGVEIRVHGTTLYNSIYRFDDAMLVNTHVWGLSAFAAPVLHLRRLIGGGLFDTYAQSFEAVWATATSAYPI